jgi:AraC-like DNA-binding protein
VGSAEAAPYCRAPRGSELNLIVDTSSVAPDERFSLWSDAAQATFEPMAVTAGVRQAFHGRVWRHRVGPLTVSRLAADTSVVRRTEALVRASDLERFELAVQLRGRCVATQDGRRAVLEPGAISSWHSSRPYTIDARTPFEMLLVYCPDPLLRPHLDRLARRTAEPIAADRGVGRVLLGLLTLLADEPGLDDAGHDVAESVLSLVRALHRDAPGRSRSSAALRAAIQATIEERLGDPALSAAGLARAHHISRSYLDRLFAQEGTSVGAWIRSRRLARVRRDLLDPALAGEPVAAIGARWGFPSPAHLARVFRAAYGESPAQARCPSAHIG